MAPKAHTLAAAAGALVFGVAAGPILVPAAVHAAGFSSHGVAAGSWAASLMRSYGGSVPPGSLCALLQRVGATGLSTSTIAVMEATAAAMGVAVSMAFRCFAKEKVLQASPALLLQAADTPMLICSASASSADVSDVESASSVEPLLRRSSLGYLELEEQEVDGAIPETILQVEQMENDDEDGKAISSGQASDSHGNMCHFESLI